MGRFFKDVKVLRLDFFGAHYTSQARTLTTFPVTTLDVCLTKMNVCYDQC